MWGDMSMIMSALFVKVFAVSLSLARALNMASIPLRNRVRGDLKGLYFPLRLPP